MFRIFDQTQRPHEFKSKYINDPVDEGNATHTHTHKGRAELERSNESQNKIRESLQFERQNKDETMQIRNVQVKAEIF